MGLNLFDWTVRKRNAEDIRYFIGPRLTAHRQLMEKGASTCKKRFPLHQFPKAAAGVFQLFEDFQLYICILDAISVQTVHAHAWISTGVNVKTLKPTSQRADTFSGRVSWAEVLHVLFFSLN